MLVFKHERRRGLDGDDALLDLRPGAVAGDEYTLVPEPGVSLGLDDLFRLVIDDLVAPDLPRILFDDDVAGESGYAPLDKFGFIRRQMDRIGIGAGIGRLQHRPFRHVEGRSALRPIILRPGSGTCEHGWRRKREQK